MDKLSYAIGLNIANNLKSSGFANLSVEDFAEAVKTVYNGESAKMTDTEARTVIQDYFEKAEKEKLTKNLEEGNKFLAENENFRLVKQDCSLPGSVNDDNMVTFLPSRGNCDGFFIAVFKRKE